VVPWIGLCYRFLSDARTSHRFFRPETFGQPDMSKGAALCHACQTAIQVHDPPAVASSDDHYFAGTCDIYVSGFVDAGLMSHSFCSTGVSLGTMIKTFVAYIGRNPQFLDQHNALGLAAALRDAYPCPVKK
jgi:Rap1a immunity proteins